jgi:hypothetical protein
MVLASVIFYAIAVTLVAAGYRIPKLGKLGLDRYI